MKKIYKKTFEKIILDERESLILYEICKLDLTIPEHYFNIYSDQAKKLNLTKKELRNFIIEIRE